MREGLSIESIENTNEDVVITYTPSLDVSNYSYTIIKNGVNNNVVYVDSNVSTDIILSETGTYKIEIVNTDNFGNQNNLSSGEYKIDKNVPIINIKEKTYKISTKGNISFMNGVTASDVEDGNLTNSIITNIDSIDFTTEGIKEIQYSVSDIAGNTTTEMAYVTVVKDNTNLIRLGQISVILILILVVLFVIKYIRSIKLEKRFSKYTINSSKNSSISLLDNLNNQYNEFINKFSIHLSKSEFLMKRAKRYAKYVSAFNLDDKDNMKFMANKIVIGVIYILFALIVKLAQSTMMMPYEMIIPFIIGFYTLDIIYIYKYKRYKKKIENDLLEAITIMNNSFKAGRSIKQAIDIVSSELDGPISKEFSKISMELSLGLDIEVAFKRFSDRINIQEAIYLTSSLSVLNKTGGNIIKVFDSIEKTMFSKKKLHDELKSLTSSSRMIMYVLIFVPIAFIIFIALINKNYFEPLFTNPLGIVLIIIMIIIYITYIFAVRHIMKVRM